MSARAIRQALQKRLAALTPNIETVFDNQRKNPQKDVPYQLVTLIRGNPLNPTLGDDYFREVGTLRIRLFYPVHTGAGSAEAHAESLRSWFPRGSTYLEDGIKVIIERTPSISPGSVIQDRYVVVVDVSYFASVYNA